MRGLTAKNDRILADKLADYKKSLSDEELEALVNDTKALLKYQEEPSTREELETIPMLEISDIRKEALPIEFKELKAGDTTVLTHDIDTNGIGYLTLAFDIRRLPDRLIPYMGIFRNIFSYVNTEHFSYADLASEINANSGGITSGVNCYTMADNINEYRIMYEIKAKVLYDKLPFAFEIISEIIKTSDYTDEKRLLEILNMLRSRLQMSMMSAGHSVAAIRALAGCSETAALIEKTNGIEFYRFVDGLISDFDNRKAGFMKDLKDFAIMTFRPENLFVDYIADKSGYGALEKEVEKFTGSLFTEPVDAQPYCISMKTSKEGYKTSAKVQYVATAGNFIKHGYKYNGALRVLRVIMGYDYLWINVRVKGGAYGCMNSYSRTGDMYLTSYRDPNLTDTLKIYKGAADYIRNFAPEERDMTKYIIGTISDMDVPLTPRAKGTRSMSAYLSGDTYENIQKERDEILSATAESIRKLAGHVGSVINDDNICVLGGEEIIEKEKVLFDKVETLL